MQRTKCICIVGYGDMSARQREVTTLHACVGDCVQYLVSKNYWQMAYKHLLHQFLYKIHIISFFNNPERIPVVVDIFLRL